MKKLGLFFSMLMCMFLATSAYAQDGANYNGQMQQSYNNGCEQPADCAQSYEKPCGDCYCLYCKYEPCYYNKKHCEYVPKYTYKKCCKYVPQYYQKRCCRYVPQYYYQTCCKQVPQYYYTCQCHYEPKYTCEKCCTYKPKYYYKHVCEPTCTPDSCSEVR